jgi:hypothetical protein
MTLEESQLEMQTRSQVARQKRNKKNAQRPRKAKLPPRSRASLETLIKEAIKDPSVKGSPKVELCKLLAVLEGRLSSDVLKVEKDEPEEPQPVPIPAPRGADLAPARPV